MPFKNQKYKRSVEVAVKFFFSRKGTPNKFTKYAKRSLHVFRSWNLVKADTQRIKKSFGIIFQVLRIIEGKIHMPLSLGKLIPYENRSKALGCYILNKGKAFRRKCPSF